MNKKAFSLIEMSIVLTIVALVMGIFLSFGKSIYDTSKIEATKYELQTIKNNIIAYAATHGYLPKIDNDGDGIGDINTTGLGGLPYIDLNIKSKDKYGMVYQYDVLDGLISSDDSNICTALSDINMTDYFPQVVDESNISKYVVAAVIISKGSNKELSGENADNNRLYEMSENRYNANSRDDLVMEITTLEIIGRICDLVGSGSGTTIEGSPITVIVVTADTYYYTDEDPTCTHLPVDSNVSIFSDDIFTFYQDGDDNCNHPTVFTSRTYEELSDMDVNPNDNIILIDGSEPTLKDN